MKKLIIAATLAIGATMVFGRPHVGITQPITPQPVRPPLVGSHVGENNPAQFLVNCWSQKAQMELDAKTQRINEENAKRRAEAQEKADRERAQVKQAIEAKAAEQVAKKAAQEREDRRRKILGEGLYRSSKRKTLSGPVPILSPGPRKL